MDKHKWNQYNNEFRDITENTWKELTQGKTTPEQFATDFNAMLASFLNSKPEFQKEVRTYFKHKPPSGKSPLEEAKEIKKNFMKKAKSPEATEEDRGQASQAIRNYDYQLKLEGLRQKERRTREQTKAYNKNFFKTAKDVTNGTFGQEEIRPTFDKSIADTYFKEKYAHNVEIDTDKLHWFPKIEAPTIPYNLNAYKPSDIRKALGKKDKSSAPGYDDIVYECLMKMPYVHHVFATLFTRIRDDGVAPDVWGASKIKLIHKDGPTDIPSNFRMIALTLNIAKLYHTLEAQRTLEFMIANKYLDPTGQKAYLDGVNGCVEHITVVQEIIDHATSNKKSVNFTRFDLEDAFGSLSHELIPYVFSYYNIPKVVSTYITSHYTKLVGTVETKDWKSEQFNFNKGAFQGDPFSGAIFLVTFNPIIQYIKKHEDKQGYEIKLRNKSVKNVISTPFADDFNIISKNKALHQKLVLDVENKIRSMGSVLKPRKCRSLSIKSGKPEVIDFNLTNEAGNKVIISSVLVKPLKFLGAMITESNTPSAKFELIHDKLKAKLNNIDKSTLRGEHKLAIYSRYALPSMRFFMSVHHINKGHQETLDLTARKYLKSWLSIPSRGATDASLFHPYMLNVKSPSQLYKEASVKKSCFDEIEGR